MCFPIRLYRRSWILSCFTQSLWNFNFSFQSQFCCIQQGASLGSTNQKKLSDSSHAFTWPLSIFLTNCLRQKKICLKIRFWLQLLLWNCFLLSSPKSTRLTYQSSSMKWRTRFQQWTCTSSPVRTQKIVTFPVTSVGQVVSYPNSKNSELFRSLDMHLSVKSVYITWWELQVVRNLVFHFPVGLAHLGNHQHTESVFSTDTLPFHSSNSKFPNFLDKCTQIYFGEGKYY